MMPATAGWSPYVHAREYLLNLPAGKLPDWEAGAIHMASQIPLREGKAAAARDRLVLQIAQRNGWRPPSL